jgi:hypothetical protein
MTSPARHTIDATLAWALDRYGVAVGISEIREIAGGMHEQTWRDGVKTGRYPKPFRRGRWFTEEVIAALARPTEKTDDPKRNPFDDFDDIQRPISEAEHRPEDKATVLVFPRRSPSPAR